MFGLKTIAAGLAVGAILGGGAGLGGVALWSKTPWSASSKLAKTREGLVAMTADRDKHAGISEARRLTIVERDALIGRISAGDATDATATAAAWGVQCSAAFNAGVSAGRRLCNANSSSSAGQPAVVGLRPSFRTEFAGERYTAPADRLPGPGQR